MRTRKPGMWWGTAVEAPDPAALARFYSTLLEWPVVHEDPGQQRTMQHLDFQVDDLDDAVAEAVALGATLTAHQPQPHVRVLLDPAGHPFCLCLEAD